MPERGCVSLDNLANCVANCLEHMIAACETVGRSRKATGSQADGQRVIGVHHLVGYPRWFVRQQVVPFDPWQHQVWMEQAVSCPRQTANVNHSMGIPKLLERGELDRQRNVFSMVSFNRFHDP